MERRGFPGKPGTPAASISRSTGCEGRMLHLFGKAESKVLRRPLLFGEMFTKDLYGIYCIFIKTVLY